MKKGQNPVSSVDEFIVRVSSNIRQLRKDKALSQEDVAGLSMSVRSYVRIEKGEVAPTLRSLYLIANGLGVQPREFFKGIEIKNPDS